MIKNNNNEDILSDWFNFRKLYELTFDSNEKNIINFDKICKQILRNIPKSKYKLVKNQLYILEENFMNYICYNNEKYYKKGFCDGIQIIIKSIENFK